MKEAWIGTGVAEFRCNACGRVVTRNLGWKTWHPSHCGAMDRHARLYRISAPAREDNAAICADAQNGPGYRNSEQGED